MLIYLHLIIITLVFCPNGFQFPSADPDLWVVMRKIASMFNIYPLYLSGAAHFTYVLPSERQHVETRKPSDGQKHFIYLMKLFSVLHVL